VLNEAVPDECVVPEEEGVGEESGVDEGSWEVVIVGVGSKLEVGVGVGVGVEVWEGNTLIVATLDCAWEFRLSVILR
jgi:hypothetical protein